MSDWEEIRRLAADFQRAQLAGSAQKLSERNCIEIVTKLIGTHTIRKPILHDTYTVYKSV